MPLTHLSTGGNEQPNKSVNRSWLVFRFFQIRFLRSQFLVCQRQTRWSANPVTSGVIWLCSVSHTDVARSLSPGVARLVMLGGSVINARVARPLMPPARSSCSIARSGSLQHLVSKHRCHITRHCTRPPKRFHKITITRRRVNSIVIWLMLQSWTTSQKHLNR